MEVLAIINALNALMKVGAEIGININKLNELRNKAEAEGRELTPLELQSLARDSQDAIDTLRNA
jgi:hypothetical protein